LRELLADSVYDYFASALRHREERSETLETVLVSIDAVEPLEARMDGAMAEITIKFAAQVVNVLRDADGEILTGAPDTPDDVVDIWTFVRDAAGADPNWQISATRKAN
jgi:predicted lipid-binding transport protein (Tim44 family)